MLTSATSSSKFGSANSFHDAEIAGLVCPRPLYIEVGARDDLFDVASARPDADKVRTTYAALGMEDRFRYREHDGDHEFDKADDGIDFLESWMRSD